MENQNQSRLARAIFPALWASYLELLRICIGPIRYLHLLWSVEVTPFVFVLRHMIENRSINSFEKKSEIRVSFPARRSTTISLKTEPFIRH